MFKFNFIIKIQFVFLLCIVFVSASQIKTYVREYTYKPGEADSKISCRVIALAETKRKLLEEIGTYLYSNTKVTNFKLEKDEIVSISAGVLQSKIIEEKWTIDSYWIKVEFSVDVDNVLEELKSISQQSIKNNDVLQLQSKTDSLLFEINSLKNKIENSNNDELKQGFYSDYKFLTGKLNSTDYWLKGNYFLKLFENQKAIECYNHAILLDSTNWNYYKARGLAFFVTFPANFQAALSDFSNSIKLNPVNADLHYFKGSVLIKLEAYVEAIKEFDLAIKIDSMFSPAYAQRAKCFAATGNTIAAIKEINKAIMINPKSSEAYSEWGYILINMAKYSEAIPVFDTAITLSPHIASFYIGRGCAYGMLGNNSKSILDHTYGIQLEPKNPQSYFLRATAYMDIKEYSKALSDLTKVVEILPNFSEAYYNRGRAYLFLGNKEKGLRDLQSAASLGDKKATDYLKSF